MFFALAKSSPIKDLVLAAGIVGTGTAVLQATGRGEQHHLFRMENRKRAQHDLVEEREDGVLTSTPSPSDSTTTELSSGDFARLRRAKRIRLMRPVS